MGQILTLHPETPQKRLVSQAVEQIRRGAVIAYPTDSAYALGCHIGDKSALDRIRRIRMVDDKHNFTLMCRDLAEVSIYAKVDNQAYRFINSHTPGPYTFILPATRELPRRLQHPKRRTVGIRVPDNAIVMAILNELQEPLMSSTLMMPNEDMPLTEAEDIEAQLGHQLDVIIDGGHCGIEPTTVVNLATSNLSIDRVGKGDIGPFSDYLSA